MEILSSAHTWFFDSIHFDLEGTLNIELVEGIKSNEKELVEVDENTTLGPYHPVNVSEKSKMVSIQFPETMTYSVTNESYDIGDEKLEKEGKVLFKCSKSNYLEHIASSTSIKDLEEEFSHYLVWTEDYLINVVTNEKPIVKLLNKKPNINIERTSTYAAI